MRAKAAGLLGVLLFGFISPLGSADAWSEPTVVLAQGGGPGDGWAALRISLPAGTSVAVDFSGTDAEGMWMDSYYLVPLDGDRSPSGGHLYGEDGTGIGFTAHGWVEVDRRIYPEDPSYMAPFGGAGWVQREDFEGYLVLIIGGTMASHSWKVLTNGPGHAELRSSGTDVTFLRGEDFQTEKSAKASAEWVSARAATTAHHSLTIDHALFGSFLRYHGIACLYSISFGGCPLNQATLSYRNSTTTESNYQGWFFNNDDPGQWQFSIGNHTDVRTYHAPGNYNTGIVLLAADVTLPSQ